MHVSYDAVIPGPVDAIWRSLTDIERVLAALPGAALASDGDAVSGTLRCKLGPTQVTYRVTARAHVGEPDVHTALLTVSGDQARGSGTLTANLTVTLRSAAPDTRIQVSGDIAATGRGTSAEASAWQRVVKLLVASVMPPEIPAAEVAEDPEQDGPAARPALSVAPDPVAKPRGAVPTLGAVVAVAALVAVVVVVRGRKVTRR